MKSIEWINGKVRIIDQTRLPENLVFLEIDDYIELCDAIKRLRVRGAPAIGIAGAFGVVLGIKKMNEEKFKINDYVSEVIKNIRSIRPTAKNLFWALDRMYNKLSAFSGESMEKVKEEILKEALDIYREDEEISRKISENGSEMIKDECSILTHCNTGFLVTAGIGTALGIVYKAVEKGKKVKVYADETRPLLQGARLTAWELKSKGIDVTLICDSSAAFLMKKGLIDCIIVGADRIASNGDTANKIGTYNLSVLADKHNIPFYIAAPHSTFDFSIETGDEIPIEERKPEEVSMGFGKRIAPEDIDIFNPAFDITPNNLITAFITEEGIYYPPYGNWKNLKKS